MIEGLRLKDYLRSLGAGLVACRGDPRTQILGATNDSRQIRPGWLFVAVRGQADDGHRYLEAALLAGAVAVISERSLRLPSGVVAIQVTDAYAAAGIAAEVSHGFPATALQLIGITGTNGKTTTAFLLREIFSRVDGKVGMLGTVGYDCGGTWESATRTTPDPFVLQARLAQMVENGCRRAVLEVSSHALLQKRLGRTRFAGAIFTNLSGDHLDYHGNMENYYQAKKILFRQLLRDRAPVVINGDDAYGRRLFRELADKRCLVWGRRYPAAYRLQGLREGLFGQVCQLGGGSEVRRWRTTLLGDYNAANMASAALLARGLGVDWSEIVAAFAATSGVPGRLQPVRFPNQALALVDYAHTDDALFKVLRSLKRIPHNRLLVLFGCGGDRDRGKRPRMGRAAAAFADRILVTSDNPRSEDPAKIIAEIVAGIPARVPCRVIVDRRQALTEAVCGLQPGDLLLVAGKGHENYQEIGNERFFFDDRVELLRLREELAAASC